MVTIPEPAQEVVMAHPCRSITTTIASLLTAAAASSQLAVEEFLIPRASAFPHDPAVAADGRCWYTDQQNSYIGRFDPVTRTFVDWPTPTPGSGPHGITIAPDGYVYYTGQSTGRIGRVDPQTGAIREYVLPANANRPHTPLAHQGAIWFTCQSNATYGRLDPVGGGVQVYPAPAGSLPYGLDAGPDGYLWIALFGTNNLGRVDPANGALRLFPLPNTAARPRRLAVARDGFVWYTDFPRGYLGRLDPTTGQVREWLTPDPPPGAYGISIGTDSRVWFHGAGSNFMIAFDPRSQQFQTAPIPTAGATVRHMVTDFVRGRLWLALSGTQRLGKVELGAPITTYGVACSGMAGVPGFPISGVPRIGMQFSLGVDNTVAPQGALFAGLSNTQWLNLPLPLDLTPIGSAGCWLNASAEVVLYVGAPASVPVGVPVDGSLAGGTLYFQWALLGDPSGKTAVTTQGAKVVVIGL
jgi:virginiamycin B lyase